MTGKARRGRHQSGDEPAEAQAPEQLEAPGGAEWEDGEDPAARFAEAVLADPGIIQRRLDADLAEVAALDRGGVRVDPALEAEALVLAVRESADKLGFRTPVTAAVEANERVDELPLDERESARPIEAYHRSASLTVANGEVMRELVGPDSSLNLVFHRRVAEPNHTYLRLETTVGIDTGGGVRLVAHGWPTAVTDQPVHSFGGTAEGYAEQLVADLRVAVKDADSQTEELEALPGSGSDPLARAHFERAMSMAFGFAVAQNRDGYLPEDRLMVFQDEVVTLVARSAGHLARYLETAFDLAEQGGLRGWTGACVRRSAVEGLFAGFLGSAAFELVDADVLTELHQVIDEAAEELAKPGTPPADLPQYNHDWWIPGNSL